MVRQLGVGGLERGEHPGTRHARRALDVVVEGAVLVAVFLQEPEGILIAEVLELDECVLSVPVIYPFLKSTQMGMVSFIDINERFNSKTYGQRRDLTGKISRKILVQPNCSQQ